MAARQDFYAEDTSETTHTGDTAFADKVTLTFTPDASSTYLLIWTALVKYNATGTQCQARLFDGTSAVAALLWKPQSTTEYRPAGGVKVITSGVSPTPVTYKVQMASGVAGSTVSMKQATLIAIKADALDQNAAVDGNTTHSGDTLFSTVTTLTFTPPTSGDYLVIASAECSDASASILNGARLLAPDGTTAYGTVALRTAQTTDFLPWMAAVRLTLANSSQSIKIQQQVSSGANTSTFRNARIYALRLDTLDANNYGENRSRVTTVSASMQDGVSVTNAAPAAVNWLALAGGVLDDSSTSNANPYQVQTAQDGSVLAGPSVQSPISASAKMPYFMMTRRALSGSSTTFKNQYDAGSVGGQTIGLDQQFVALLQLDSSQFTAAEAALASDVATRVALGLLRTAAETALAADTAARAAPQLRTAVESVLAADAATRAAVTPSRTAAESVLAADVALRRASETRIGSENAIAADAATHFASAVRAATESATAADVAARATLTPNRSGSEAATAADLAIGNQIAGRITTESVVAADSAVRAAVAWSRVAAESPTGTEGVTRQTGVIRAAAENPTATDLVARAMPQLRMATESVMATDSTERVAPLVRSGSEEATSVDLATGNLATDRTTDETVLATETAAQAIQRTRTGIESALATEATTRTSALGRGTNDSASAADMVARSVVISRSADEPVAAVDTATIGSAHIRAALESGTATDAVNASVVLRTFATEATTATDISTRTTTARPAATDFALATDTVNRAATATRAATEAETASDSVIRSTQSALVTTETVTSVDSAVRRMNPTRTATETADAADAVRAQTVHRLVAAESAVATDEVLRRILQIRSALDAALITDLATGTLALGRFAVDRAEATDRSIGVLGGVLGLIQATDAEVNQIVDHTSDAQITSRSIAASIHADDNAASGKIVTGTTSAAMEVNA